jgi:hypothetical protein
MKDKLEKYVSDNRPLFDEETPGDKVWEKIAFNLNNPKVRKMNWQGFAWKVAAVVIIFIASWFFHDRFQNGNKKYANLLKKNNEELFIKRKVVKLPEIKTVQPVYYANTIIQQTNTVPKNNNTTNENKEITEVKAYYTTQINERENEIYKYAAFDPNIKSQIKIQFNELDSIYGSLRRDLKDNINNKEVVEAMIQNYRIRLEILENMLQQLKGNESTETKKPRYEI